jgi:dihydrolipoamide dehydrogenase
LRLGSQVDVVEYADRILPAFDNEVGNYFYKLLKKNGMNFHLSHKVVGGSNDANGVKIITEDLKVSL